MRAHGTNGGYTNGCRCDECREAHRRAAYEYRKEHREEINAYKAASYAAHKDDINERMRQRKRRYAANLNILKTAQGCSDCGTKEGQLDYHHIDPSTKKYNVSQMVWAMFEAWLDEVAKCTVLCASCHAKRHHAGQIAEET